MAATLSKTTLKQIGELMWGDNFAEPMGEVLDCTGKSVRRYVAGQRAIPEDDIRPKLMAAMIKRRDALTAKISALEG